MVTKHLNCKSAKNGEEFIEMDEIIGEVEFTRTISLWLVGIKKGLYKFLSCDIKSHPLAYSIKLSFFIVMEFFECIWIHLKIHKEGGLICRSRILGFYADFWLLIGILVHNLFVDCGFSRDRTSDWKIGFAWFWKGRCNYFFWYKTTTFAPVRYWLG